MNMYAWLCVHEKVWRVNKTLRDKISDRCGQRQYNGTVHRVSHVCDVKCLQIRFNSPLKINDTRLVMCEV